MFTFNACAYSLRWQENDNNFCTHKYVVIHEREISCGNGSWRMVAKEEDLPATPRPHCHSIWIQWCSFGWPFYAKLNKCHGSFAKTPPRFSTARRTFANAASCGERSPDMPVRSISCALWREGNKPIHNLLVLPLSQNGCHWFSTVLNQRHLFWDRVSISHQSCKCAWNLHIWSTYMMYDEQETKMYSLCKLL